MNLVTPEPWIPHVVLAINRARRRGLRVPVVYNTSGFVTAESLQWLAEIVDVYLTDVRYATEDEAHRLSGSARYFQACRDAAAIMWKQVGRLRCTKDGIASRGLIIRHLLLPGMTEAAISVLSFVANHLPGAHVSLMGQYEPVDGTRNHPTLGQRVPWVDYLQATRTMRTLGLVDGWRQHPGPTGEGLLGSVMKPSRL